jgi:hypothetical protein
MNTKGAKALVDPPTAKALVDPPTAKALVDPPTETPEERRIRLYLARETPEQRAERDALEIKYNESVANALRQEKDRDLHRLTWVQKHVLQKIQELESADDEDVDFHLLLPKVSISVDPTINEAALGSLIRRRLLPLLIRAGRGLDGLSYSVMTYLEFESVTLLTLMSDAEEESPEADEKLILCAQMAIHRDDFQGYFDALHTMDYEVWCNCASPNQTCEKCSIFDHFHRVNNVCRKVSIASKESCIMCRYLKQHRNAEVFVFEDHAEAFAI